MEQLQTQQTGDYSVRVANTAGETVSAAARLEVFLPDQCAPVEGAVAWWPGDDNAKELLGQLDGLVDPSAPYQTGVVNRAFGFDGLTQSIRIPYRADLFAAQYSVEAWVMPQPAMPSPENQSLIFGQAFGGPSLAVRSTTTPENLRVVWLFRAPDGGWREVTAGSDLPVNTFTHIAGTWDGVDLRLYLNGVLADEASFDVGPTHPARPYYIGGLNDADARGQFFHGRIDELTVYNRALPPLEVSRIYHLGSAGKCKDGVSPSILTQPSDQTIAEGVTTLLQVPVVGSAPFQYQWFF